MFCNNCNVLLHAAMTKAGLEDDCDACGEEERGVRWEGARARAAPEGCYLLYMLCTQHLWKHTQVLNTCLPA